MTPQKLYGLGGETYVFVADHPDPALVLVQEELEVSRYSYDGPQLELGRIVVRRRDQLLTEPPKPHFAAEITEQVDRLKSLQEEVQKLRETKNKLEDEGMKLLELRDRPDNQELALWYTVRTAPSVWAVWRRWRDLEITEIKRIAGRPPLLGYHQTPYKHDVLHNTEGLWCPGEHWYIYPVNSDGGYEGRWYPCKVFPAKDEALKFAQQSYDIQSAKALQAAHGEYIACPEGLTPSRLLELQGAQLRLERLVEEVARHEDSAAKSRAALVETQAKVAELSKESK